MKAIVEMLRTEGLLGVLDQQFASAVCRLAGEERSEVLLAAAILSQQVSRGHVCLDLADISEQSVLFGGKMGELPSVDTWVTLLRASPLVSDGSTKTPLVLSDKGWLYMHRYWEHEEALAGHILARADAKPAGVDAAVLMAGLDRLFPPATPGEFDDQRMAAFMAVRKSFCVVSGGPGTGKTHTVVKILALLIEQALAAGQDCPHMTLVAPTGKAAARMVDSIKKSKATLDCSEEVRAGIVESASTIHRCLGSIGGSSTRFRHNPSNLLVTDLVLVDEASMVNLGLMRRLASAMPAHARLILLGDMDQLASVEAGSVLGDICNSGNKRTYSPHLRDELQAIGGGELASDRVADPVPAISDCVAKLTKSYRFEGETGIAWLAKAINQGDVQGASGALERFEDVELVPPGKAGRLSSPLKTAVLGGYKSYLEPGEISERLARFDQFRVLCARRSGAFGVEAINELVVSELRRQGLIEAGVENYEGRPVMITANTYELQLYNGDVGLVLPDPQSGQLRACFAAADGLVRMFAPSRLPYQESALAMSVHKSQGSEFDEVAIVLPDEPSPLLSRELIYTAVTRARKRVVIHGHPAILRYAIEHPTQRRSGLRPALWD